MKNITFKLILNLTIVMLIVSCGNDRRNMYTKINEDGSIYREFVETGDSAFMVGDTTKNSPFLVRVDSTWKITYCYGHDSMPHKYISGWPLKEFNLKLDSVHHLLVKQSKTFKDVHELNSTFTFNLLPWKINQEFSLNKKFKWFYTAYEYIEVFKKLNPNPQTKISDFLTEEEISHYNGENYDYIKGKNGIEIKDYLEHLEDKCELWISKCYYDAYYDVLLKNLETLQSFKIDSIKFRSLQNYLFDTLENKKDFDDDSIFFIALDKYFQTNAFIKKVRKNDSIRNEIKKAVDLIKGNLYYPGHLDYGLTLPGKIVETNSAERYGDTLTWVVNHDRFLFSDYKIYAKSRKPNYWAFAVTGIIVLLGVLGLWIKRK